MGAESLDIYGPTGTRQFVGAAEAFMRRKWPVLTAHDTAQAKPDPTLLRFIKMNVLLSGRSLCSHFLLAPREGKRKYDSAGLQNDFYGQMNNLSRPILYVCEFCGGELVRGTGKSCYHRVPLTGVFRWFRRRFNQE